MCILLARAAAISHLGMHPAPTPYPTRLRQDDSQHSHYRTVDRSLQNNPVLELELERDLFHVFEHPLVGCGTFTAFGPFIQIASAFDLESLSINKS